MLLIIHKVSKRVNLAYPDVISGPIHEESAGTYTCKLPSSIRDSDRRKVRRYGTLASELRQ